MRQAIVASYAEKAIPIFDTFSQMEKSELFGNVQLVLGLLRELHPEYYELEHLHCIVELLEQRARNVHNVLKAQNSAKGEQSRRVKLASNRSQTP